MKKKRLLFFIPLLLCLNIKAQNLLPEWHREYQVEEEWSIDKAIGVYRNDSLNITVSLEKNDGRLKGVIESPYSEGFLMFEEEKNKDYKIKYKKLVQRLIDGWISKNDIQIYDVVGGRWFKDSVSTDRYVLYFKQNFQSLNNETDSIKNYRVLGTYKRDQWDYHGYSNDGYSYGTYIEVKTYSGKTKYIGLGWQNQRPLNIGGLHMGDQNHRFSRKELIFEPRSPSKFVAFDVVSDLKTGINFLPKGMSKKDYQKHKVKYCYIGDTKFIKVE
nr:hypothetical protein [uncultured Psychroserpens sp.]